MAGAESRTMPPQRSDLVLTSDIPNGKGNVLVFNSLDVESWNEMSQNARRGDRPGRTDCWNGSDNLAELQLVQNGGLTSGIETDLIERRIVSRTQRMRRDIIP